MYGTACELLLPPNLTMKESGARIYRAPTLEALAEQLEIPLGQLLLQTVADYNLAWRRN